MKSGFDLIDEMAEKGYSYVECSKCGEFAFRKATGVSPNRRRKYYYNEKGEAWRGKKCPACARKEHTEYMRVHRAAKKLGI